MGTKTALHMEQSRSMDKSADLVDNQSDFSDFSDRGLGDGRNSEYHSNGKKLTPAEKYEMKLARRIGYQFKLKKPDFMVYMKKHPTYTGVTQNDSLLR